MPTVPTKWPKESVVEALLEWHSQNGCVPRATDVHAGLTGAARRYFGSWNAAIIEVFGALDPELRFKDKGCPFTPEEVGRIEHGEFKSRRELYQATGGRNGRKIEWLNEHGFLIPVMHNHEDILRDIRRAVNKLDRIPNAADVDPGLVSAAQRKFGSWNEALYQATGKLNQKRYDHISNDDLLMLIRAFTIQYQRLPTREEFDGVDRPYFETYFSRFGVTSWADVIVMVNLEGVRYFNRHGWGTVREYKGRMYLSHGEYLIGKYLTDQGIAFEKEVPYGNGNHVFDFHLPELNLYIEYYGIETPDYRERVEAKRAHYAGRRVIEIFKHDNTVGKLASEVQRL